MISNPPGRPLHQGSWRHTAQWRPHGLSGSPHAYVADVRMFSDQDTVVFAKTLGLFQTKTTR